MTTKYDVFVEELQALCIKHQVCLDFGYEGCKVFDIDATNPYDATGF